MPNPYELLVKVAASYEGVTESANKKLVDSFRAATGVTAAGQNYCMDFVQFCLKKAEFIGGAKSGLLVSQGVMAVWNAAKPFQKTQFPAEGLIAIWEVVNSWEGHCGVVTSPGKARFQTVEANTSPDPGALTRVGLGVFVKIRNLSAMDVTADGQLKLLGFLNPYV